MDVRSETITLDEELVVPVGFAFILLETAEDLDIDFIGAGNNVLKRAKGVSQSFKIDSGDIRIIKAKIRNSDPLKTQTIKYGFSDDVIRGDFDVVAGEISVSNLATQDSGGVVYTHPLGVESIDYGNDTIIHDTQATFLSGGQISGIDIGSVMVQNTGNYLISVGSGDLVIDAALSVGFLVQPGGNVKFKAEQNEVGNIGIVARSLGGPGLARLCVERLIYDNIG